MSSKKKVTQQSPIKLGKAIQEAVISQISGSSNTKENTVKDDSKKMTVVETFGNKPTMKDILTKARNNNPVASFMAKINKK